MSDLIGITTWGVVVGVVAFAVVHHNVRGDARTRLTKWCLGVGAIAISFFIVNLLIATKIIPLESAVGFGFIGMPALVLGALLSVTDAIGKGRRRNDNQA